MPYEEDLGWGAAIQSAMPWIQAIIAGEERKRELERLRKQQEEEEIRRAQLRVREYLARQQAPLLWWGGEVIPEQEITVIPRPETPLPTLSGYLTREQLLAPPISYAPRMPKGVPIATRIEPSIIIPERPATPEERVAYIDAIIRGTPAPTGVFVGEPPETPQITLRRQALEQQAKRLEQQAERERRIEEHQKFQRKMADLRMQMAQDQTKSRERRRQNYLNMIKDAYTEYILQRMGIFNYQDYEDYLEGKLKLAPLTELPGLE